VSEQAKTGGQGHFTTTQVENSMSRKNPEQILTLQLAAEKSLFKTDRMVSNGQ